MTTQTEKIGPTVRNVRIKSEKDPKKKGEGEKFVIVCRSLRVIVEPVTALETKNSKPRI